ncbi:MAG: hypothetical protein COV10_02630 [Candidatus Vogelbacteria bacterium CG10_big_fil_rev_8_21_14_0_10_51_16]|uniref:histidine kinase n=1 Tax=Candidatus Vogelbacteria bacterium CG10_big_fil_rev_8_21_14_0_10_51_16 TaxID=1975045 RepID=A0A2H0REE0_9BACT|nr:MAG: hypothetical protein COV10_02630 [Candidatus Vogelbacteria bacterium CG10_big_fil_rev_8_21_14_0_10_51_16]
MVFTLEHIISILLLLTAIVNVGIGVFVLTTGSRAVTWYFFVLTSAVSLWVISNYSIVGLLSIQSAYFWAYVGYMSALAIAFTFFHFARLFPSESVLLPRIISRLTVLGLVGTMAISIFPGFTVQHIQLVPWEITVGSGVFYVFGYFGIMMAAAFYILLQKIHLTVAGVDEHKQIRYVFTGTLAATLLGSSTNLFLPLVFGDYQFIRLGPVFTVLMVAYIAVAIVKHHLFNAKVIATELLTFGLWLFILIRTLVAGTPQEQIANAVLLLITIPVGILLIKSVRQEVKAREEIQKLAKDLELANARLTDLDRQKSEFVSIASHQLRSPLTAIKGYVSMLLEGTPSYGNLTAGEIKADGVEALRRVFKSSNQLVLIIEDLLNVSRIEQGRMLYTMSEFDVGEMAHELVENMAVNAREHGLTITFADDGAGPHIISGDEGKVRQVINNVIDNSIKYTPKGAISVEVARYQISENREQNTTTPPLPPHPSPPLWRGRGHTPGQGRGLIQIRVKDTGIGIPPEALPKLFQKFSRAEDAGKVNVTGTGIGLFIAQEIMKAHGGKVWAESEGRGKGSTFTIEFSAKTQ